MKCSHCSRSNLEPTKLAPGLSGWGCSSCEGVQVALLHYRDWAALNPDSSQSSLELEMAKTNDSVSARPCCKCSKLMEKFHIEGKIDNKIDYCSSCDEVWLDKGEWSLLNTLQLQTQIPSILTAPWQRQAKQDRQAQKSKDRLQKFIGSEEADKVDEFKQWLNEHPKRPEILFYLNQK